MSKIARWFRKSSYRSRDRRPRPPVRLGIETLEERTVPTIMFLPQYGPEGFTDFHGQRLSNVPVYLIFKGSYWQNTQSDPTGNTPTAKEVTADVQSILGGPYLKNLTQYGVDGNAHFAGAFSDPSDWASGSFNGDDLADNVVDTLQDDGGGLPEADDLSSTPIYVVVTAPGVQSSDKNAASFNGMHSDNDFPLTDSDQIPLIWLGGNQPNGIPQNGTIRDWYSNNFSHEVAEAITDINGDAIRVSANPAFAQKFGGSATGQEIGDNEADQYTYRINGVLTQSLWSQKDGAYVVSDGNTQQFIVSNGTLVLDGDQGGVRDDTITLDVAQGGPDQGGVRVTLNGEVAEFEPGQINTIEVYTGGGNDTVNVERVSPSVQVFLNKLGGGHGTVNVSPGAHNWGNVQGGVSVYSSTPGTWSENIYDQADPNAETYAVNPWAVSRANAGAVSSLFGSVGSVALYAGPGRSTIDVPAAGRTLDSMPALTIDGGGSSSLVVDDSNNAALTTYTLTADTLTRAAAGQPAVTINYSHVAGLTLKGGTAGDTFNVQGTAAGTPVALITGTGPNQVNLGGSSSFVDVVDRGADTVVVGAGQTLNGIGAVTVDGSGSTVLAVNDQANPSGAGFLKPFTQYTVTGSSVTRTVTYPPLLGIHSPSSLTVSYSGLKGLTLNAGNNGPNSIDVESTPATTTINGGAATGEVDVAPQSQTLDYILGTLNISAPSAALNVYDQADRHPALTGAPTAYTLDGGVITRAATFTAGSQPVDTTVIAYPIKSITLYTSQYGSARSPDQVAVEQIPWPMTVNSGSADAINVTAFAVPVITTVSGTVTLSYPLTVNADGGTLTLDDRASQNNKLVTYSDAFTVTDKAVVQQEHFTEVVVQGRIKPGVPPNPAPPPPPTTTLNAFITYTLDYSGVANLTIDGGPVRSSFAVQSTPAGVPVTINAATAAPFTVGATGSVKGIRSQLTLNGIGGTLLVDDSKSTTQDKVTVTPTQVGAGAADQFFGAGGSLTYGGISGLTLNLSHAPGDKFQLTPSAATAFTVNGDSTEFQAGQGAELDVNLAGAINALLNSTGPGAGNWTFGNRKGVSFSNMGAVHSS